MVKVVEVARLRQLVSMNFERACLPFRVFFNLLFVLFLCSRFGVRCADEMQR